VWLRRDRERELVASLRSRRIDANCSACTPLVACRRCWMHATRRNSRLHLPSHAQARSTRMRHAWKAMSIRGSYQHKVGALRTPSCIAFRNYMVPSVLEMPCPKGCCPRGGRIRMPPDAVLATSSPCPGQPRECSSGVWHVFTHLESNVHMPTPRKPKPASNFNVVGETNLSSCPPTNTPIPAATTNAAEAPKNTSHLFAFVSEENSMVASWVLSPISARKIVTKTAKKVCQVTFEPPSLTQR
jgi:hypothetical protein